MNPLKFLQAIVLAEIVSGAVWLPARAAEARHVEGARLTENAAVRIDGDLRDPAWQLAEVLRAISFPWSKRAAPATEFRAVGDAERLYFAFKPAATKPDFHVPSAFADRRTPGLLPAPADAFQTRGVVLVPEDLSLADWPERAPPRPPAQAHDRPLLLLGRRRPALVPLSAVPRVFRLGPGAAPEQPSHGRTAQVRSARATRALGLRQHARAAQARETGTGRVPGIRAHPSPVRLALRTTDRPGSPGRPEVAGGKSSRLPG